MVLLLAGPSFAQEDLATPRAPGPIASFPVAVAPLINHPGHYTAEDWRALIDSYRGPGIPAVNELAIFDLYWKTIDGSFACFQNLSVDWTALRATTGPKSRAASAVAASPPS